MPLLQLKEVGKEFANVKVLDQIDMTIEEGDIVGIVGESGSGKTTLLNLLTGFMEPSQGEVLYYSKITHEPKNMHDNLHKIKKHIGFAPQHNSFYPRLTVKENLFHFGQMYGIKHDILVNNIKSLLLFTGLFEDRNKLAEHLSGGMQKRLNISTAMVHKPKILVLDEPTADLDPLIQKEILLLLEEANKQGITVILASHHLDTVEHLCNKVAVIHKGQLRSFGALDDIKKPFLRDYFTINLRPGDSKEKVLAILKKLPVKKIVDEGKSLAVYPIDIEKTIQGILSVIKEENLYLHDLDLRKPSLNEVFETIATGK